MPSAQSNIERAAVAYVRAREAWEKSQIARDYLDMMNGYDGLRIAVEDLAIPADQRQDVARFDGEGGA